MRIKNLHTYLHANNLSRQQTNNFAPISSCTSNLHIKTNNNLNSWNIAPSRFSLSKSCVLLNVTWWSPKPNSQAKCYSIISQAASQAETISVQPIYWVCLGQPRRSSPIIWFNHLQPALNNWDKDKKDRQHMFKSTTWLTELSQLGDSPITVNKQLGATAHHLDQQLQDTSYHL